MEMRTIIFNLLAVLICASTLAQDYTLIKNVTVWDGQTVWEENSILLRGDRIAPQDIELSADDVQVIDGKGGFVIPALINAHVHVWTEAGLKQAADAGVLTLVDMHGSEDLLKALKQTAASSYTLADLYYAGNGATPDGGHGTQFGIPTETINTVEEAHAFVQKRIDAGADHIKILVEPYMNKLPDAVTAAVITEANKKYKKAVVHVSRKQDALFAFENNAAGLVHLYWDNALTDEELKQVVKSDGFIIPTMLTTLKFGQMMKGQEFNLLTEEPLFKEVLRLHEAGVLLVAGTDPPNMNINYGTDLYEEIYAFAKAGFSNAEALQTATYNAALAMGYDDRGHLATDKKAHLVVLNSNPLDDITSLSDIKFVMKNGKKIAE